MAVRPLFYGWVVVAIAFVTMAVAVSARTGFSLLLPEIVGEFGWSSSLSSGAFAAGFVISTLALPVVGWSMARFGPRLTLPVGGALVASGYIAATWVATPVGLYAAFGLLVLSGSMAMSYISHALLLSRWFSRRLGLAVGIAYAGVGAGGLTLIPAMQWTIEAGGWRTACLAAAAVIACVVIPLNALFQRGRPEAMGLRADGEAALAPRAPAAERSGEGPTLRDALRRWRFWTMFLAFFCALFLWYGVQVHQTRFLIGQGVSAGDAALALGLAAALGVPGQIGMGALSDRWGRAPVWLLSMAGFALTAGALLWLEAGGPGWLVWAAAAATGLLANAVSPLFGTVPGDMFAGRHYAAIFTAVSFGSNIGAGAGVWAMGALDDLTGGYRAGLQLCVGVAALGAALMWATAPDAARKARR
ncbi:MAG: MFS transporter [Rubrimonas sp.]|uniref:MFS transporter n=1 Tax=Rubrimonas sp. TaxID=2036015 RepID=UPI002FDD42E7